MRMDIRRAADGDAEAIAALHAELQDLHALALPRLFKPHGPESFAPERVRALLHEAQVRVFLACEAAAPVGYVYAEVVRQSGTTQRHPLDHVYVHHLHVAPAFRQHGHGRRLLEAVAALAREEGIAAVSLDVWAFNAEAQAFFAAAGFAPLELRLWKEGT